MKNIGKQINKKEEYQKTNKKLMKNIRKQVKKNEEYQKMSKKE